ncbi:MAG: hypothetical protein V3U24_04040, partial [Candidatus Neomarinimicrobiota bacterium]
MKFFLPSLFVVSCLYSAPVHHEIVFEGGETISGRVARITGDSLYFQPFGLPSQVAFSLEDVLYSHDGEGRLFHISQRLKDFIQKAVGRGGTITTKDGQVIPYVDLEDELFMHSPGLAFRVTDSDPKEHINLWSIHKLTVDHTLSEYAVRKGFYAGSGLALLSFLLKFDSFRQFLNFNKLYSNTMDVYPSAVTFLPLMTTGWVIYDLFRGDRE